MNIRILYRGVNLTFKNAKILSLQLPLNM